MARLAKRYLAAAMIRERLSRRFEASVLEEILNIAPPESIESADALERWAQVLIGRLNEKLANGSRYSVRMVAHDKGPGITLTRQVHGNPFETEMTPEFFESSEFKLLTDLAATLHDMFGPGGRIERGERNLSVGSFKPVMEWLMSEARRGLSIQRYKGLGEMNPDQLWETTMDSETRRMLQVQIEDAVAADEIFTTLMGDNVEPRRDFIEQNALSVANLDV